MAGHRIFHLSAAGALAGLCLLAALAASTGPGQAQSPREKQACAETGVALARAQQELTIIREVIDRLDRTGHLDFTAADNARNILNDMVMRSVSFFSPMSHLGRYNLTLYHLDQVDAALADNHDRFVQAVQAQHPAEYRLLAPMLTFGPESARGRKRLADALGIVWRAAYIEDRDAFLHAALTNAEIRLHLYDRYDANAMGARRHEAKMVEDVAKLDARLSGLNCPAAQPMPVAGASDPIARAWLAAAPFGRFTVESDEGGFFTAYYTNAETDIKGEITLVRADAGQYRGILQEGHDWPSVIEGEIMVTLLPDGQARIAWHDDSGRGGEDRWR